MTDIEAYTLRLNGLDPRKIEQMAKRIFSFLSASGLTAREAKLIIREMDCIYENKREQDLDLPLMDVNKEYTTEKNAPDSSENIFNYIVLQKLEDMQRNITETQKMLESQQRQFQQTKAFTWIYTKRPLIISITALVISVVMTIFAIVY